MVGRAYSEMVETSGFLCTVDVDTLSGHIAE